MHPVKLLHITAHMGGGVGRVLSRLAEATQRFGLGIDHTIACLEHPDKSTFVEHARRHGATVLSAPDSASLAAHVVEADIVQIEWWHHPLVAAWMGRHDLPPMRLLVWSHISGLGTPSFPHGFVSLPHRFLFSSTCSLNHAELEQLPPDARARIDTVFSAAGFDDLPPPPPRVDHTPLRIGYLGTLNFAKLHPAILDFVAAVDDPAFRVEFVGDDTGSAPLREAAGQRGLSNRIAFAGYRNDIPQVLARWDVLAYVLNPQHYGTAENALLEAMAMGVVPVVLDNPAERALVTHEHTGLIVRDPGEFAAAIARLSADTALRHRLSVNAATAVRRRFSAEGLARTMATHYDALMNEPRRRIGFRSIFGDTPSDWFVAAQGREQWRFSWPPNPSALNDATVPLQMLERTKGSVFHFHDSFPDDPRLAQWAGTLGERP